jgi:hypothetical protein
MSRQKYDAMVTWLTAWPLQLRVACPRRRLPPELNFPRSYDIPHLLGTNGSFRRDALIAIGGFDKAIGR